MAHLPEPIGVDLLVAPSTLTKEDQQLISQAIAEYRRTKKSAEKEFQLKRVAVHQEKVVENK